MKYFKEHFVVSESNCNIISDKEKAIQTAKRQLIEDRGILKSFIRSNPEWVTSFIPISSKDAPPIVKIMEDATSLCQVGPMAAVAGALADRMTNQMKIENHPQIAVVENGGEISIHSEKDIIIGLVVLTTILKAQIGFRFIGGEPPLGVATSSGQFGHSISFGEADAATIFAKDAALADAAATSICNYVKGEDHEKAVLRALEIIDDIPGIKGAFIVRGKYIGKKGSVPELVKIKGGEKFTFDDLYKSV